MDGIIANKNPFLRSYPPRVCRSYTKRCPFFIDTDPTVCWYPAVVCFLNLRKHMVSRLANWHHQLRSPTCLANPLYRLQPYLRALQNEVSKSSLTASAFVSELFLMILGPAFYAHQGPVRLVSTNLSTSPKRVPGSGSLENLFQFIFSPPPIYKKPLLTLIQPAVCDQKLTP